VKELGPGSAADAGKAADVAAGGAPLSPQKSDLALLRNANVSVSVSFLTVTIVSFYGLFSRG